MEEIINWLREVEHLAGKVYSMAASKYADEPKFKKFLERSAEDEAYHYRVMGRASEFLSSKPSHPPEISVDEDIKEKILNYFLSLKEGMERQTLDKEILLENIVEAEFSEWNDIFIYVVNSLKERTDEFKFPAAKMQAHINSIADYIENVEDKSGIIDKVKNLPPVWIEKILIVDDTPVIANFVKDMLKRDGIIDIAENGKAALELIDKRYYKLIMTDIDMPVMDGITLFEEAVKRYPTLKNRFLFMTGDLSPERNDFCNNNNVMCLEKPISVMRLREETKKIILS